MQSKAVTVDAFLAEIEPDEREVFAKLRKFFTADPRVTESMKYRMPTYLIGETMVGAFNKQKQYLCLYVNPAAADPYRKALASLDCGKSCIRFKSPGDLPLALAAKMIKAAQGLARGS